MSSQMDNKETAVPVEDATQEPLFDIFEIIILGGLALIAIYWFFFRSKKNDADFQIRKLNMVPTVGRVSDSSFINKMKSSGRNVVVFYGSQTGTAEEYAGRLAKDAVRYGMKGMVADPEECDMEELTKLPDIENSLAIFCMATYGEGDPTDNAQEFYEFLQSGNVDLTEIKYAVFGLGNKTYEHYNDMGKYVDKRMEELGAERVFDLGLGDDDGNLEDDFITWREAFWPAVCTRFGIESVGEDISIRQYKLTVHEELPENKVYTGEVARLNSYVNQRPPYDAKNPFLAPIRINRELYKGDRSCMHIEFDITDSKLRYETGDHVAVYPVNDTELVEKIGQLLNTDLDVVFTLNNVDEDASKKHPFPCPCSYRTALLHYLDITSHPRTNVLKEIADYASNDEEKQKLLKMASASAEGKALYNDWIIKATRNIISVLEDLPSVKPAIDHLCELLPRLQCRYYSISSSPKLHPTSIHITASLIKYTTSTGRTNKGVTTNWLALQKPTDNGHPPRVPIFVRRSQFRLPFKHQTSVIMIGPGTGLAPFRGFIQERHFAKTEGKPMGETILYFGCRKKAEDFMYQEELEEFLKNGTLQKLYCAFSRDQTNKVYVYHLLKENSKEVWQILENGGHVYVCGDARVMARDVHRTVEEIIRTEGGMTPEQSAAYIKKLETQRRYSADVWS